MPRVTTDPAVWPSVAGMTLVQDRGFPHLCAGAGCAICRWVFLRSARRLYGFVDGTPSGRDKVEPRTEDVCTVSMRVTQEDASQF